MRQLTLATIVALVSLCPTQALAQGILPVGEIRFLSSGCAVMSGSGAPNGVVTGSLCDIYIPAGAGQIWQKTSGSGTNTGWTLIWGGGTSGQVLRSGGSGLPAWSTATFPATATTTGAYLRADGTNWITSTLVLPNAATQYRVPFATATNTWGDSSALTFDGTNLTTKKLFAGGDSSGVAGFAGTTYDHVLVAVGFRANPSDPNPNPLTYPHQVGVYSAVIGNSYTATGETGSSATNGYIIGFETALQSASGGGATIPWAVSYAIGNIGKAVGDTITRTAGITFTDDTAGTNNAAITTFGSTFTGNWFIYYPGSRPNNFGTGNVQLGAEVFRSASASYMRIAGGGTAASGAVVTLFGSTHATNPNQMQVAASGGLSMSADTTITGTATISGVVKVGTDIFRSVDTSFLRVAGGGTAGTGAVVTLFGSTHATNPSQMQLVASGGLAVTANTSINGTLQLGPEVFRTVDTSYLRLASGSSAATGANIILFGPSHATNPNQMQLNATGGITVTGSMGVGAAPVAKFDVLSTTEQLRLRYNTSNYANATVSSIGKATFDGAGTLPSYYFAKPVYMDELTVKAFIAELSTALAGSQIITKSVTKLAAAYTMPATGSASTITVNDLPNADGMAVFESGDTVRIRTFSRASGTLTVTDAWGVVTSYADGANGTQTWTFTRNSGSDGGGMSTSTVVPADSLVLDYGVSGNGFVETTTVDGAYGANSPYQQIATWSGASPIAANQTVRTRVGRLDSITGGTKEYGFLAGTYSTSGSYFRASNSAFEIQNLTLSLKDSTTQVVALAPNSGSPYLGLGNTPPTSCCTTAGIFLGWDHSASKAKASFYSDSNNYWTFDGAKVTWKAANTSLDASGNLAASSATLSGAITATSGSIGSFTIGTYLYSGSKTAYNDGLAGVHVGSDGIGLGAAFTVSPAGAVTASNIAVTGGTMGGFTVSSTEFTAGSMVISGFSGNIDTPQLTAPTAILGDDSVTLLATVYLHGMVQFAQLTGGGDQALCVDNGGIVFTACVSQTEKQLRAEVADLRRDIEELRVALLAIKREGDR